ncbi:MAG: hypothetical protein V1907_03165 [Candidatus Kerfeldbacteria bacterium]
MKPKGIAALPIVVIILAVLALGVTGYFVYNTAKGNLTNTAVSCTTEAKICPDGTAVGRTGPDCEFAACPANTNKNANVNTNSNTNTNANSNVNASANATKDWKTYEDKKYNFSVKYPLSWSTKLVTTGYNNEGPYVVVFTPTNPPGPLPFISVRENWTIKQEVDRINALDAESTHVTSQEGKIISGISGTEIMYTTAIGSTPRSFIVVWGGTTVIFNVVPNQTDWETVIGTLVFPTTADPTAGWKTYTNSSVGYSVKYPASWVVNDCQQIPSFVIFDTKKVTCGSEALGIFDIVLDADGSTSSWKKSLSNTTESTITIDGITALRITGMVSEGMDFGKKDVVFVTKGSLTIQIQYNNKTDGADQQAFNSLLSTFTFTK